MLQHLLSFLSCPQNGSWSSLSARYTVGKIPTRLSLSPRHKTCFRDSTQLARQKLRRVQAGSRSRGPGRPRRARAGPAGRSGRCGVVSVGGAVDPAEAWSGGGRALAQPCRSLCEDVRGAGEEAVASLSCSLLRLGPLVRMARECADEMGERRGAAGSARLRSQWIPEARLAGRRGLADESPWIRQGGDPVFAQRREGRLASVQPERVPASEVREFTL